MALDSKTVLVTGASRGTGAAAARALSGAGAGVVVHYNANRENAENLPAVTCSA